MQCCRQEHHSQTDDRHPLEDAEQAGIEMQVELGVQRVAHEGGADQETQQVGLAALEWHRGDLRHHGLFRP